MSSMCAMQLGSVATCRPNASDSASGGAAAQDRPRGLGRAVSAALLCRKAPAHLNACCFQNGAPLRVLPRLTQVRTTRAVAVQVRADANSAHIEFVRGVAEPCVPEVRLTRSLDGGSGTATFVFDQPAVFQQSSELGDITGLYMVDEEGVLQSMDVSARFKNGQPMAIEARYIMRSEREWDRFMRFMERYAETAGLGFTKK